MERPSGSCHLHKDRFSPCLPHKLHQAPLPTVLTPRTCPSRVQETGCPQPALHLGVHAWLAACPGDQDLLRREKPCVEYFPLRRQEEEKDWVSLPSLISGEMPSGKGLQCRPEMLLPSILSCSPGASAGESSRGAEAPAGRCFAVPLSLALAQHNWFFSEKAVGRQRELGKVVLLQSDEGLGGLEALSRMAGRGQTGGAWTSFSSVWAMKPPSPWHQRSLLGTTVPSPCWWLTGGDVSLLVPVATPQELLVTC